MKLLIFKKSDCSYYDEQKIKDIENTFIVENWTVEIIDVEKRDGSELAKIYDLIDFPSLVITTDDNSYVSGWRNSLPSVLEIRRNLNG